MSDMVVSRPVNRLIGLRFDGLPMKESKAGAIDPFETISPDEPIPSPLKLLETKVSLKDRAYNAYGRICMMATPNFVGHKSQEKTAEDETNGKKSKMLGGLAILGAGITTAAGIYIASKSGTDFSSHHEVINHVGSAHYTHAVHTAATHKTASASPSKSVTSGTKHHSSHAPHASHASKKLGYAKSSLHRGSNLWFESKKELGKHASLQAIANRDDLLLKLNHLSPEMARHLRVGYRFLHPKY